MNEIEKVVHRMRLNGRSMILKTLKLRNLQLVLTTSESVYQGGQVRRELFLRL